MSDVVEKLKRRVRLDAETGCWLWQGGSFRRGYGAVWHQGRTVRAHRLMWTMIHGPIPACLFVCHACDNPPCCNPAHLFLGTHADNVADRDQKGRQARGDALSGDRNGSRRHPEALARGPQHSLTMVRSSPRGDDHWTSRRPDLVRRGSSVSPRLLEQDVIEIRRCVRAGESSQIAMARQYGLSRSAMSAIVLRRTWRHLP